MLKKNPNRCEQCKRHLRDIEGCYVVLVKDQYHLVCDIQFCGNRLFGVHLNKALEPVWVDISTMGRVGDNNGRRDFLLQGLVPRVKNGTTTARPVGGHCQGGEQSPDQRGEEVHLQPQQEVEGLAADGASG